jgi:hypothetical protein
MRMLLDMLQAKSLNTSKGMAILGLTILKLKLSLDSGKDSDFEGLI